MLITLDTTKEVVIVPNTFYKTIDNQNRVLAENGADVRVDYTEYVKTKFAKAIENPMIRKSDVAPTRRRAVAS